MEQQYAVNMYMEDVQTISLKALSIIETELKKYGIVVPDEELDQIYVPMVDLLEKFSNGNYRHEH